MTAGILELLGDIQSSESIQDFLMARSYYQKGLKYKPNHIQLMIKLARSQEKLREFDAALSTLNMIIRRDANNFEAYYKMGLIYIRNN